MEFSFFWKHAGLMTIWTEKYAFHVFPSYKFWQFGKDEDWYDGPYYSLGLGPLLLVCWN